MPSHRISIRWLSDIMVFALDFARLKRWHSSLLTEKERSIQTISNNCIRSKWNPSVQSEQNPLNVVCRLWNENALVFVCALFFLSRFFFLRFSVHIINLHLFDVSKRIFKYFVSFCILCVGDVCCCCSSLHSFNSADKEQKKGEYCKRKISFIRKNLNFANKL